MNGPMARIEAAIETDKERHTGCVYLAGAGPGTLEINVDRLFAKDGFARARRGRDEVAVCTRITHDENRVDLRIIEDEGSIASSFDTVLVSQPLSPSLN